MTADQETGAGKMPGPARYSPEGERRKREIFLQLRGAMARRRGRRTLARFGAAGVVPLIALGAAAWMAFGRAGSATGGSASVPLAARDPVVKDAPAIADRTQPAPSAAVPVEVVRTDPERVRMLLAAETRRSMVTTIGDDELLAALSRAGTNCGIVRAGNRTVVTDNDRGEELRTVSLDDGATGPADAAPVAGPGSAI